MSQMDPNSQRSLEDVRAEIDSVDERLIELLNRRTELAIEIGALKSRGDKPFFTPERERAIYESLAARNSGPLRTGQLAGIFREIISAARAAEQPLRVSYWGPEGSYSHLASMQTFGSSSEMKAADSIHDVFLAVEHGSADYGVVPIENSIAGVVPETLDQFAVTNVKICAETYVPIHHHLVSAAPNLEAVRFVYAGPQPFAQCRRWLRDHVPTAEIIEVVPTSLAARKALDNPEAAAIANRATVELVGIPILAEGIEDHAHNQTRFLVVGFNEPAKTGRDKTSVIFNLRNRPGELYRALGIFDAEGVNLSMIESRPAPRASFEYLFYCDFEGHIRDDNVRKTMEALKGHALETIWLGSYPAAVSGF